MLLSERFYYSIIHVEFVYQYRGYQLLDLNALKIKQQNQAILTSHTIVTGYLIIETVYINFSHNKY